MVDEIDITKSVVVLKKQILATLKVIKEVVKKMNHLEARLKELEEKYGSKTEHKKE